MRCPFRSRGARGVPQRLMYSGDAQKTRRTGNKLFRDQFPRNAAERVCKAQSKPSLTGSIAAFVDDHVEDDLRVAGLEVLQHAREVAEHEAGQRVDAQPAGRRGRDLRASGRTTSLVRPTSSAQSAQERCRPVPTAGRWRVLRWNRRCADEGLELLESAPSTDRARDAHLPCRAALGEALRLGDGGTNVSIAAKRSIVGFARAPASAREGANGRLRQRVVEQDRDNSQMASLHDRDGFGIAQR